MPPTITNAALFTREGELAQYRIVLIQKMALDFLDNYTYCLAFLFAHKYSTIALSNSNSCSNRNVQFSCVWSEFFQRHLDGSFFTQYK